MLFVGDMRLFSAATSCGPTPLHLGHLHCLVVASWTCGLARSRMNMSQNLRDIDGKSIWKSRCLMGFSGGIYGKSEKTTINVWIEGKWIFLRVLVLKWLSKKKTHWFSMGWFQQNLWTTNEKITAMKMMLTWRGWWDWMGIKPTIVRIQLRMHTILHNNLRWEIKWKWIFGSNQSTNMVEDQIYIYYMNINDMNWYDGKRL